MYKQQRVLAVTLARGGSKSIPHKNLATINEKPLLLYTSEEVKLSKYVDKYIISTDCSTIKKVAEDNGVECPFVRPSELASDEATSADALIHAVDYLQKTGLYFDYVVEVMATNPLKSVVDIDACIEMAIDRNAHSCVAVNRLYDQHPSRVKFIEDGFLKPFYPEVPESRRQDLKPQAYVRSGSIYVVDTEYLLKYRSRYSEAETLAYIMPDERVINIDEPDDLELARIRMS